MPWYHEGEPIAEDDAGLRRWLEEEVWYNGVRKRGCRDDVLRDWILERALERVDEEYGTASKLLGHYYDRHEEWNSIAILELYGWDVLEDDATYEELKAGVEYSELEWRDERRTSPHMSRAWSGRATGRVRPS